MMVAKLSDDFSKLKTQPKEIFRANEPSWAVDNITDGCWVYKCKNGELLMLWSNFEDNGYCIGIAHSQNGEVSGQWVHEKAPLYKRNDIDHHDGGHGMIFSDTDGKQYLCCHSPNKPCEESKERTVLLSVEERNGTLCIK